MSVVANEEETFNQPINNYYNIQNTPFAINVTHSSQNEIHICQVASKLHFNAWGRRP